jgi:hypothetical protein
MGGTNAWATIYDDIVRAPILPDGSLGAFVQVGKLAEPRAGHSAVLVGRQIIVSGGHTMDALGPLESVVTASESVAIPRMPRADRLPARPTSLRWLIHPRTTKRARGRRLPIFDDSP